MPKKTDAFRANVRRYCRIQGMTLGELAKKAELSREWLSTMLGGKANPTLPVCERLAKALNMPLEVLVAVPAPETTISSGSVAQPIQNVDSA